MKAKLLFLAASLLMSLSSALLAQVKEPPGGWPGGKNPFGNNPFGQRGQAGAFNLGPLGARATVVSESEGTSAGLAAKQAGLKVAEVVAGQAGAAAGLETGDIIAGANGQALARGSDPVHQLAALMEQTMTKSQATKLLLSVLRGGKALVLKVSLPALGPHSATCPRACRHCGALMDASFAALLKLQSGDGSFPTPTGGNNGAVAVTSISGLAMIAAGGMQSGSMAAAIRKAKEFVVKTVGKETSLFGGMPGGGSMGRTGGGNWSQVNWSLGYGALFLAEYAANSAEPDVLAKLAEVCRAIEANQEANGGWAHGPGGANALGYTDFAAVTNVVLAGYGAASRVKIKTLPHVVTKAVTYLAGTGSADGGVGYSQRSGQKGFGDAGRTGGSILAFALCRQQATAWFGRMAGYYTRHLAQVPEGHASPVHHFALAAMAAWEVEGAWSRFLSHFRLELAAARNADGTFYARPSKESASMGLNTDQGMGPCWTTGTYLLVWNLPRGNLYLYGKKRRA